MWQLTCKHCGWQSLCDLEEAVRRLRQAGLLRREREPRREVVAELLPGTAARMSCPQCGAGGLIATDADDATDDDDWQTVVLCEICRQPIPPERIEALPHTRRCVACQGDAERGAVADDEPEFCPKCGALVELRVSRGSGLTRYKRFCTGLPPCRL
jgi:hypothetical protein